MQVAKLFTSTCGQKLWVYRSLGCQVDPCQGVVDGELVQLVWYVMLVPSDGGGWRTEGEARWITVVAGDGAKARIAGSRADGRGLISGKCALSHSNEDYIANLSRRCRYHIGKSPPLQHKTRSWTWMTVLKVHGPRWDFTNNLRTQ